MTPGIEFVKMEAVGNDFVLVEAENRPEEEWPRLAQAICSRRFGIGSDGLLVVGPSDRADFRMRMYNPDGTEDHCGNGIRCAIVYAVGDVEERNLTVQTLAGLKRARVFRQNGQQRVEVDMGSPSFAPHDLPMSVEGDRVVDYPLEVAGETLPITVVSTGTTHTVLFLDEPTVAERFERLSPALETHPLFPDRTSVMWATVQSPERIKLRIWERGVGETLGCGTGACATLIAARLHGLVGDRATVASPGGELEVFWPGEGACTLTGSARTVFRGRWTG